LRTKTLHYRILVADLTWVVVAMCLAYLLRYEWARQGLGGSSVFVFGPPLILALLLWTIIFSWLRLDGFHGGWRFSAVLSQLLPAVLTLMLMLLASGYITRWYMSRLALGFFGALLFVGLVIIRLIARHALASRYRSGMVRRVVIVGSGSLKDEMTRKIEQHPELLCEVVGFLGSEENAVDTQSPQEEASPVSVQTSGIVDLLHSRRVDEIILTVPKPGHPEILQLAERCRRGGIAVSLVPQPYELYLYKPELRDLDGLPLLQLVGHPIARGNAPWKRPLDLALTVCLLPFAVPILVVAAAVLKFRKGNAFCRELRSGLQGGLFWMYRLNSERHATGLPAHESLMQHTSVTELPQLFNVLRGEMSLVGPRPEGPERARHYSEWHRQRLSVKPGITGLAQVHGLRDGNSSEDKTRYDLQYILQPSPFQDISLVLQTAWTIIFRLFRLPRRRMRSTKFPAQLTRTTIEETLTHAHSSQSRSD
jgi:lipopolysaccharide/colanic/teichoic acid biosynthesis glycosyltransferase